jgi:hypothetical protein
MAIAAVATSIALKACFVISPMGPSAGETRRRADYVLKNFIKPACLKAGFDGKRSDELDDTDITRAIRDSLLGSPMTIAYLGSRFVCAAQSGGCKHLPAWNDNVMVEVGYRLASQLPLLLVCDEPSDGGTLELPTLLGHMFTFMVPAGKDELDPQKPEQLAKINELVSCIAQRIKKIEDKVEPINSTHAVALVHRQLEGGDDGSEPESMYYVGASKLATELFGVEDHGRGKLRLAGRTMGEFLENLRHRMPPAQYEVFLDSQNQARSTWTKIVTNGEWKTPTVHIPIVFDRHPLGDRLVGRAYLPIIVSEFRSGVSWSTLNVLYLDVTSATRALDAGNGIVIYTCDLDPQSTAIKFPPKSGPMNVFLCHHSEDKPVVESILHRLLHLDDQAIHPWLDKTEISGADAYMDDLSTIIETADVAFIFFGPSGIGPTQEDEINSLMAERKNLERKKKLLILPILLDGVDPKTTKMPACWTFLKTLQYAKLTELDTDDYLIRFFDTHFPGRLIL